MYTDQEFIARICENDQKVIRDFIQKYQDYLYSICTSVLKNKEEAEEATQDSFLKIFKALPSYVPKGKLTTWMYTVAYRTSLDYIKKRKYTDELSHFDKADSIDNEENLILKERKSKIQSLLDELPPEESGLVRLFYMEEQSVKEISSHLDLSESNVKVKLYRARKNLFEIASKKEYFKNLNLSI